jgi:hypothetical protein
VPSLVGSDELARTGVTTSNDSSVGAAARVVTRTLIREMASEGTGVVPKTLSRNGLPSSGSTTPRSAAKT